MPLNINQNQSSSLAATSSTNATQTTSVSAINAFLANLMSNTQGSPSTAQLLPLIQQLLGQLNQQPAPQQAPAADNAAQAAKPATAQTTTQTQTQTQTMPMPMPMSPVAAVGVSAMTDHAADGHTHPATAPLAPAVAVAAAVGGHDHSAVTTPAGAGGAATTVQPGHDFYSHVSVMYPKAMSAGETKFGGYAWANATTIVGQNPITGLQPVIDQAISDVLRVPANKKLAINDLESKVAQRLTQLNDWTSLNKTTQAKMVELTGVDFGKMTKAEQEKSINHLLHSPQPFGDIEEPLTPNMRIDLNYTHTLDKTKTTVTDKGNGLFEVNLLSNNNNGSHTGHSLGSFNLKLAAGTTAAEAKTTANAMVINTNKNNELYLSASARQQLATVMGLPAGPQAGGTYSSTGEFQSLFENFNTGGGVGTAAAHADHADVAVGADGKVLPGHDFVSHVRTLYPNVLAEGQTQYGGYAWVNSTTVAARSPITGLKPVIDQAISDVMKVPANKKLPVSELESKVAQRLTQLNDWTALNKDTKAKLVELTGVDFGKMTRAEQEKSINHLLHSPLPFGDIQQVLRPDMRIDMAYTHTLDKTKTTVQDLGNGLFDITMISNNNNGSHTGHNLGSFNLQLAPGMTVAQAKEMANNMVINSNNNNELYLSDAGRAMLETYLG